jgi:Amt family ammonium transporter
LLRKRRDGSLQAYESQSLPLGLVASVDLDIVPTRVPVERGDDVFVFSDGLTESMDETGRLFGVEGVQAAIQAARLAGEGFGNIMRAVSQFRGGTHVKDDLSLISVSVGHTQPSARGTRAQEAQESRLSTESSRR